MTPTVTPKAAQSPQPVIDLKYTAWQREQGGVTVYGTWTLTNKRPCLVLLPSAARPTDDVVPCLVPLDMAWAWDEHTGDPAHCAQMTFMFAQALGLSTYNPRALVRLTAIIRDHLGDLLTMPPLPESEAEVVADAIMVDRETGQTKEAEISDHV